MTEVGMEPKAVANVFLTPRDLGVLESLYANCVMTFSQIAKRHFPNASKPTVLNRLAKLERAMVLRRERIPRMELGFDKHAIGVVFQITRDGISVLRQRRQEYDFKLQPLRIHPYTLHHDLVLVDLAAALKVRFANATVTNGRLHKADSQTNQGLEPDIVVTLPDRNEKIAIELELSDKSEKRYREIVLRYRLSKEYGKVIYFIDDPFVRGLLTRVILNRNPHPQETPPTGKFYFSPLSQFINSPTTAPILSGAADIREKGGSE
jgi:DNA-binding Lrp family transcriptional regulator